VLSLLFLVLTLIFVATTGDSMSYVIAMSLSNEDRPTTLLRVFWGISMAIMALVLIWTGAGGIGSLQSFIVVTAVPVSLVLLPSLWDAARITVATARDG
jgi:choline-glycine betaine transporter